MNDIAPLFMILLAILIPNNIGHRQKVPQVRAYTDGQFILTEGKYIITDEVLIT